MSTLHLLANSAFTEARYRSLLTLLADGDSLVVLHPTAPLPAPLRDALRAGALPVYRLCAEDPPDKAGTASEHPIDMDTLVTLVCQHDNTLSW